MAQQKTAIATFGSGCFWCTESDFEKVDGVVDAVSGYTGGQLANPTYKQVSSGGTGHIEAVQVRYDPRKLTYQDLLAIFWRQRRDPNYMLDPAVPDLQGRQQAA